MKYLKYIGVKMEEKTFGPSLPVSEELHREKYRGMGESFRDAMSRIANTLADNPKDFPEIRSILLDMKFLPAGRVQSDIGSPRRTTAFNCFVSDTIEDSMDGIMRAATEAAQTMRLGGGIGYDFSTLRPRGDNIVSLDSRSSGPVSFMRIFDAVCKTISSAGHRRGAQMGVLRIDHPDIEEFIEAKANETDLTQFNISVGVTDAFMEAVKRGDEYELKFDGRVYKRIDASMLWNKIMALTWDWAEPGILFIDRINERNNLFYCETIAATNPCGEQPLPPNGACLLGSFNLVKYLKDGAKVTFDWQSFEADIPIMHRAMDNVIDRTSYPLAAQRDEAASKRRMGIGITGLANTAERLGHPYSSTPMLRFTRRILRTLTNVLYASSAAVAKNKGHFPLFDFNSFKDSYTYGLLDDTVRQAIKEHGLRNSHLTSIAPTGTISFSADNISSGIEPPFSLEYQRTMQTADGAVILNVKDYAFHKWGLAGKTSDMLTVDEHLSVLVEASKWVDSAVSKTINVGTTVKWEEFKGVYMSAWESGCKGVTTFRANGKRFGILNPTEAKEPEEGGACFINPEDGTRSCE
jgi:ribonucleoside-diphosphate reductase alpha chain